MARSTSPFAAPTTTTGDVGIRTDTPDEDHWFNKKDHYALFAPLIAGLDAYAAANGIDKLVITGHSLGASMVEALVDEIRDTKLFDGIDVEAVNFASPGYAGASNANKDLTTFNLRGDIVPLGAIFSNNAGDENWIYHNVDDGIHAMSLHAAMLDFFADNGLTFAAFNDLYGIDYDRIHVNVHHAARDNRRQGSRDQGVSDRRRQEHDHRHGAGRHPARRQRQRPRSTAMAATTTSMAARTRTRCTAARAPTSCSAATGSTP